MSGSIFGKLNWSAIPFSQPIPLITSIVLILIIAGVLGLVTVKRWWPYLWREWITSVDHKRIGIMYCLLGIVMLIRGFADAIGVNYKSSTIDSGTDPIEIQSKVSAYLRNHPKTDAILTLGPVPAAATLKAVQQMGLDGKIKFYTFDFSDDIYDEEIDVAFVGWVRPEEKFADAEALKRQMKADSAAAREKLSETSEAFPVTG